MIHFFKNLFLLKPGDEILVETKDKDKIKFVVVEKEVYDYRTAPLEKIFGVTSTKNLNLITCSGDFIRSAQTKDKRVVIFATAM
jgi:sortase (surface protein transpeptidase)